MAIFHEKKEQLILAENIMGYSPRFLEYTSEEITKNESVVSEIQSSQVGQK